MGRREAVRRGRAFWVKLVRQWRCSGQSQREFSEARGVSVCTLQYWVYKLRDESAGSDLTATKPAFVEVRQAPLGGLGQIHRLRLGDRVVLELSELPPAAWLRELC